MHILEHGQMEMDKEPLLYEQAGRDNFCPDVVINSNCCKPPQPLQLPIGIRQRYACSSPQNYGNLPKIQGGFC